MDRLRLDRRIADRRTAGGAMGRAVLWLALLATAACQTTVAPDTPSPAPRGLEQGPGRAFSTGKGWSVTVHKPAGSKPYCQAARMPPSNGPGNGGGGTSGGGPRMIFRTAAAESGFILADSGATVTAGERYDLTASFDQGAKLTLGARGLPGGLLYVAVPTKSYLDELDPFARNRRVTFRSTTLGDLGTLILVGTSWAINASDECRILNAEP